MERIDTLKNTTPFTVATSVYENDSPKWFEMALASIVEQTVPPSEIVLVVDGPVSPEIDAVIATYSEICAVRSISFKTLRFEQNKGLGEALRVAVEASSNELIARMDSDDIARADRFELQLGRMGKGDVDICGGQIEEFVGEPSNVVGKRVVPLDDHELKDFLKERCPFNHMTVMYKRTAVLEAGNYQDWFWNEDYYLWIRMALKNQRFANLPDTLVRVRVGEGMYARRGGKAYYNSEIALQKYMLKEGVISYPLYASNCVKRFVVQLLMPNALRGWVFKMFARS